jgi:hypothetical protein
MKMNHLWTKVLFVPRITIPPLNKFEILLSNFIRIEGPFKTMKLAQTI